MSSAVIKWLLTRLLPGVLLSAALVMIGWRLYSIGYDSGHKDAKAEGYTALAKEQKPVQMSARSWRKPVSRRC